MIQERLEKIVDACFEAGVEAGGGKEVSGRGFAALFLTFPGIFL